MKAFIQIADGEKEFLLAVSAIAAISKNGEGCLITLNTLVEGFDSISKAKAFDVPFEDVASQLASETRELSKGSGSWGLAVL